MPLNKETFLRQIESAAAAYKDQPVTSALLGQLSAELSGGAPPWWQKTREAWENRQFLFWNDAWRLFLTCVHYEVLNDAESALGAYFPSCGGTPEADPSGKFSEFLKQPPASFFENLRDGRYWRYHHGFHRQWMAPAEMFFHGRGIPYCLVEFESGPGLHLAGDLMQNPLGFDSSFVSARVGLDPKPLLLEDILHRRWLTATVCPDDMAAIAELDRASEIVLGQKRNDPAFLQMVPCSLEEAPAFVAENIPSDDPDGGLLMMNFGTTCHLSDPEYGKFRRTLAKVMEPWEDRALWVEIEPVRAELHSLTYQLRVNRLVQGILREHLFASFQYSRPYYKVEHDKKAAKAFLK